MGLGGDIRSSVDALATDCLRPEYKTSQLHCRSQSARDVQSYLPTGDIFMFALVATAVAMLLARVLCVILAAFSLSS